MNTHSDPDPDTNQSHHGESESVASIEDGREQHELSAHKGYETAKRLAKKLRQTAKKLSIAEWSTVFFTAVIAVATAWNVYVVKGQLDVMRSDERAWIGPTSAIINGALQKGQGVKPVVMYINTGKNPAFDVLPNGEMKIFSKDDWANGKAFEYIQRQEKKCMSFDKLLLGTRVVYPTTGPASGYTMSAVSNDPVLPKNKRIVVSDRLLSGDDIFVIIGCLVYRSEGQIHHSSFCFYDRQKVTPFPNMAICTGGSAAD